MAEHSKARLSLLHAALVIARRDFTAVLFSKAFFFFLIGPLFFLGISGVAGVLGAQASQGATPPRLAVAMAPAEADAFVAAHERLAEVTRLPDLAVDPSYHGQEAGELLASSGRNIGAVLQGSLAEPRLIGPKDQIERWRGEVALIAADAAGSQAAVFPPVSLQPTQTSIASQRSSHSAIATGSVTLLFLLTMLLAGMVLSNLVEEKGNKVIEILAAAVPMDAVFLGKLFAMLAISFVGIAVWGGVVGPILLAGGQALPAVPDPAVGWPLFVVLFLIYFAMAYLIIGSIFLAIGSLAPTVRDVQTMSMPATILQLIVFFFASFAIQDVGSTVELLAIAIPLSSPYTMVGRAAQDATLWWHLAAIAWQVLWVAIFVRAGATLFRRKVMQSGPRGAKKKRRWGRKAAAPTS